jgi:putative ABC transport system permease protein
MIKNFLKIAIRSLFMHKSSTFINIAGLAIGLAATIMILMWIQQELSYDRFFNDSDLLYRVEENQSYGGEIYHVNVTPYPSGPVWKERIPEIADASRMSFLPSLLVEKGDMKLYETNMRAADSTFFEMFSFPFIYGEPSTALINPHSIVLSEEMAQRYFGDENPIGQALTLERQMEFIVTGVLEKLPANTTLRFNAIIPFEFLYEIGAAGDSWGNNSITTYVKLVPNSNIEDVGVKLTDIVLEHNPETRTRFMVNPLTRIRLHGYFGYAKPVGAMVYIYIFGAISLFVLVIACINFINLSTARSANRSKEIGIKKVSGAQKASIKWQFLIESVVQVFIALLFALVLVGLLIGAFNTITGKEFEIADIFSLRYIIGYIVLALITGVLAGLYPAFYLASFKPLDVLKGERSGGAKSGRLRKILVVVQFVLSIFLATCGILIYSQVSFMRDIDMGYDKDNVVRISITENLQGVYYTLKQELEAHPLIEQVSGSMANPTNMGSNSSGSRWEGKDPDHQLLIGYNAIDYDYVETMGIDMKYGRSFSADFSGDMQVDTTGNFIINEEVAREMGKENPVGDWFNFGGVTGEIVGVMENFYFKPASQVIEPMAFLCSPVSRLSNVLVRLNPGNITASTEALTEVWTRVIPDYPLDYTFIAEEVDNMYRAEKRMGDLFKYFTILAIFLASMGLYGLSSYIAEQRSREIGIRKVMGASISNVVLRLTKEFLLLVTIALVIGLPLAWFYINSWLEDFPYRTDIDMLVFVLVALISLIVAALAVSYQSFRAGRTNPTDTLRKE